MLNGTGWRPDKPDDRDYTTTHPLVHGVYQRVRVEPLPVRVDLRDKCSPVEDQGELVARQRPYED